MSGRRNFLKTAAVASLAFGAAPFFIGSAYARRPSVGKIGIIGLDTSHSMGFTRLLHSEANPKFRDFRIVAATPNGSKDVAGSASRIPENSALMAAAGIPLMPIEELLQRVDYVILNTNDGNVRLSQCQKIFETGKPVFINKPFAADLEGVVSIFDLAKRKNVPFFSSSSMRYHKNRVELETLKNNGHVLGADTFSPAQLEKSHTDLFWYGIHAVEMLYSVMGPDSVEVSRVHTDGADVITGTWDKQRLGTLRGTREGRPEYGGRVFAEKGVVPIQPAQGLTDLLEEIVTFFTSGKSPVPIEETLQIYSFMAAADISKTKRGAAVSISQTLEKAKRKANVRW